MGVGWDFLSLSPGFMTEGGGNYKVKIYPDILGSRLVRAGT